MSGTRFWALHQIGRVGSAEGPGLDAFGTSVYLLIDELALDFAFPT